MKAKVLGSAAGGGFPQWNCGCTNCVEVRRGSARVRARTQDSLAISADGGQSWWLVNASPDVLRQIEATPELQARGPRVSPVKGVILTNGDLDHVLGLFSLRESQPLTVWATESVWKGLSEKNAIFKTLERFPDQIKWQRLVLDEAADLGGDMRVIPFAAPGKLPVHLERAGGATPSREDNVALRFEHPVAKRTLVYAAAAGSGGAWLDRVGDADVVLFDGTFWASDELVKLGLGTAKAEDMAHWPVSESLRDPVLAAVKRKVYTHVNNTNPLLFEGCPERREVERAGWEVAYDGMELV